MNSNRINILIIGNSRHHSKNILELAENLADRDYRNRIFLMCEDSEKSYYENLKKREETSIITFTSYVSHSDASLSSHISTQSSPVQSSGGLRSKIYSFLNRLAQPFGNDLVVSIIAVIKETSLVCWLREKKAEYFFLRRADRVSAIFDQILPNVVMGFGDRHIDIEVPILYVARKKGIKVILPYVSFSDSAGLVHIRKILKEPKKWLPFSFYRVFAGIILKNQLREGFFYQHPSILFALKKIGVLSKNPWCIGNGLSDIVCVDCKYTQDRFQNEGVPSDKIQVIGDFALDSLYIRLANRKQFKEDILKEYGMSADEKIIVFALPQFAEQGILPNEQHWSEIEYLVENVAKASKNVLLSLHPRVESQKYFYLEEKFPVRIAHKPLKEILCVADMFVAVNSSTVFWSVLCGVPPVVLDWYGLSSAMYSHLTSIHYIKQRGLLLDSLKNTLSQKNRNFSHDWNMLSRDKVFDGNVVSRYQEMINTLVLEKGSLAFRK